MTKKIYSVKIELDYLHLNSFYIGNLNKISPFDLLKILCNSPELEGLSQTYAINPESKINSVKFKKHIYNKYKPNEIIIIINYETKNLFIAFQFYEIIKDQPIKEVVIEKFLTHKNKELRRLIQILYDFTILHNNWNQFANCNHTQLRNICYDAVQKGLINLEYNGDLDLTMVGLKKLPIKLKVNGNLYLKKKILNLDEIEIEGDIIYV